VPNFTFVGAMCSHCSTKNPFLDPRVNEILAHSPAGIFAGNKKTNNGIESYSN